MSLVVSFFLEFLRVLFIFIMGSIILIGLETWVFRRKEVMDYAWMLGIANIIIIFVVYRNILQFNGWFKSIRNKKLNRSNTFVL